jgi:fructose-bisphosphate aldolase class I
VLHQRRIFAIAALYFTDRRLGLLIVVGREMLFTSPEISQFISGAIMCDETIRQKSSGGSPIAAQGILPGIKVDAGAKPLAGPSGEAVTEGLDGLP